MVVVVVWLRPEILSLHLFGCGSVRSPVNARWCQNNNLIATAVRSGHNEPVCTDQCSHLPSGKSRKAKASLSDRLPLQNVRSATDPCRYNRFVCTRKV